MRGIGREDVREQIQVGVAACAQFELRTVVQYGAECLRGGLAGGCGKGVRHRAEERVSDLAGHDGVDIEPAAVGREGVEGGTGAGDVALVRVSVEEDLRGRGAAAERQQPGIGEVEPQILAHLREGFGSVRREIAKRHLPLRPRTGDVGIERFGFDQRRAHTVSRDDERKTELRRCGRAALFLSRCLACERDAEKKRGENSHWIRMPHTALPPARRIPLPRSQPGWAVV